GAPDGVVVRGAKLLPILVLQLLAILILNLLAILVARLLACLRPLLIPHLRAHLLLLLAAHLIAHLRPHRLLLPLTLRLSLCFLLPLHLRPSLDLLLPLPVALREGRRGRCREQRDRRSGDADARPPDHRAPPMPSMQLPYCSRFFAIIRCAVG